MPLPDSIVVFMSASLALNITPGPNMLYVIARSTGDGRRAGVVSALGIGAGTLVHIALLALGVSTLLATVPLAYDAVRWAGALYLAWLGVRAIAAARRGVVLAPLAPAPLPAVFRQGLVTNVLNPKVALFFLAFLPQFVDPARGNATAQIVFLGILFETSGTLVNIAVALGASGISSRLRNAAPRASSPRARRAAAALRVLTGAIFLGLSAKLALESRR